MRLQWELSVRNVETASTSSTAELRLTVGRLQQEVFIERAWRERKEKLEQEVVQLWREKQRIAEETAIELQNTLWTKDAQLVK